MSNTEDASYKKQGSRSPSKSDHGSPDKSEKRSGSQSQSRATKRSQSRSRSRKSRSRSHSPDHRRRRSQSTSPASNQRRHNRKGSGSRDYPKDDGCNHGSNAEEKATPSPSTCLGVFGLSLYTTERDLRDVFSHYGPLASVNVVYDQRTGRSRGFAFVYFERIEDAKAAMEKANGMELDERRIRVDFSFTKRAHTPTPGIYMGRSIRNNGGWRGNNRRGRGSYHDGGYNRSYDRDYDYDHGYDRGYDHGYDRHERYNKYDRYDRNDRYDEYDYRYNRRRSPSPYYSRYRSRSRSRSYTPRRY